MKITKEYIEQNLLTKDKGLNANKTKFIDKTAEELYLIFHNLLSIPSCEICGNNKKFINFKKGYAKSCGNFNCSNNLNESNKLRSIKIAEKMSETQIKIKKTKKEKYNNETYTNPEKCKETVLSRYGVINVFQLEEVKTKLKNTLLQRYDDENYRNPKKAKLTYFTNHGVTSPFCYEKVRNKAAKTKRKKYLDAFNKIDFDYYCVIVDYFTNKNDLKTLKDFDKRGNHAFNTEAYHLDHIYSKYSGFVNNIPAYIIGNINNLRMIHWKENIKKGKGCSMTIDEIFAKML